MSPILIVEDEYFIAADCVSEVERRGLKALAVGDLQDAVRLTETAELDGALVDLALHDERAFSIVEGLRRRMVPVVLYTGYPQIVLPEELWSVPLFQKPLQLRDAVDKLILLMKTTTAPKAETIGDFTGPNRPATVLLRARTNEIERPGRCPGPEAAPANQAALRTSCMSARDALVAQPEKPFLE